ncbi:hypothetical protein [Paenibacillus polymyxa]|uniref:hypothetical protein n=1 Tax=Paenibacillus polymyxa TaxID=1406 RepID=UPI0032AE8AF6
METFKFELDERLTFFWNLSGDAMRLTAKKATVKEIEETGVWLEFDGEEDESFVSFPDMHLFIREGSTTPEGTQALWANQITAAHFGDVDPEAMIELIKSLTE